MKHDDRTKIGFNGTCYWCGKYGHRENNCRVKAGTCLICGESKHQIDSCPLKKVKSNATQLKCSICSGAHLGKDCPKCTQESVRPKTPKSTDSNNNDYSLNYDTLNQWE